MITSLLINGIEFVDRIIYGETNKLISQVERKVNDPSI